MNDGGDEKEGEGKVSYTQMTGSHRADGSTPHGRNFTELRGADFPAAAVRSSLGLVSPDYSIILTYSDSDFVLVQPLESAAPPHV